MRSVCLAMAVLVAACGSPRATDGGVDGAPDAVDASQPDDPGVADVSDARDRDAFDLDALPDDVPTADGGVDAMSADSLDATVDAGRDVAYDIPDGWRSTLYPETWRPVHAGGTPTADGRFLHDFSFAGYRRGDVAPPVGTGSIVRRLDAAAFGNGTMEATSALQTAIDETCAAGGGVVLLSAGTFRVRLPAAAGAPAIRIACSNLVLRGAGASGTSATRIYLDSTVTRSRAMILVRPTTFAAWSGDATRPERRFTRDALLPTRTLALEAVDGFAVGDAVMIRNDYTAAFRAEHRMDNASNGAMGDFWPAGTTTGIEYARRITAVDTAARTITVDAPTRYAVRMRDNARVFETSGFISGVGLEDFAIGMREHPTSATGTMPGPLGDLADNDYDTMGTAAYDVHASSAIFVDGARDSWISRVRTYAPTTNASGAHVHSIGIFLNNSAHRVTVTQCQFEHPQYRGGGGNGYLFLVQGMDNLIVDDRAIDGRHNFITASNASSGNVFLRVRTDASRYSDDSHRLLSHANLYDNVTLDRAWLQAVNRGTTSTNAGHTASQTVYWNTLSLAVHPTTVRAAAGFAGGMAIETAQFGWGYAIGTRAMPMGTTAVSVSSWTNTYWSTLDQGLPRDHVEGVARGATLIPPSLYDDQLSLRRSRGE